MKIPDELLAAYVDGQLQGAERARIEQAILHDVRLAQRVAQYRAARTRRRGTFEGAMHEPMSQRFLQTARSAARPASAQVIDLARVRAERKRRTEHRRVTHLHRAAIAAGLVGALFLGALGERLLGGSALTEYRDGALLARGALAEALYNQVTNKPAPGSAVHVGLTFRAKNGDYCRTFTVSDHDALAGLACHEQNRWRVLSLVGGTYLANPAALLLQTVKGQISGVPLDAQAEAKARGSDWR